MSTLRITNIEAKADPSSPTVDEKIKLTNSNGDILVHIDGKTSGITTIGINTTAGNIKFDQNSNVVVTGIITATKFVGTIEPTNLTVTGISTFSGDVTVNGDELFIADSIKHVGDTDTSISFPANDTITARTNGAERLRIASTGNIGINKTPTTYQFEVNGGTANTVASFESTDATSRILFKDNSGEAMVGAVGDALIFYTSTNATERLRITSAGNIGIGDAAPSEKLNVGGNIMLEGGDQYLYLTNAGTANAGIYVRGNTSGSYLRSHSTGMFTWEVTGSEKMRIDSNGRVMIGTQTVGPTAGEQLTIADSANSGITIRSGTNAGGAILFEDDTADRGEIQYSHNGDYMRFKTAGTERVRINSNGCLQVGEPTGTPSEVMQIRKASGDVEVISYAAPGSKTIFNCTGSNRFALERGYNSVFEIQDPNGNGVRGDLRFDGNIILNKNMGETNNSAVQLYRLIGPHNVSLGSGMAIVGGQTDTISTKAARIMTSNNNGTAWFGPYGTIHPGSYTVMFHMKVSNNSNTSTIIRIDVAGQGITDAGGYGVHRPRALNLAPSHFDNADRYQYVGLDCNFVNAVGSNVIEVRGLNFNNSRGADLYLDHILIVPRIPSHDG
jgi:hypothetical protein